ncbi:MULTISPECIES: alpha/beta hydrolase [unclassified Synechococcus]|uniref:alpha/beta hydrolase n=1 Tax=unclassified Synechococcus TaxID=2626047 RepID=UPI0021A745CB|nr:MULTISPECIES: alpha/beta hydrolase [unclassified Synechococcus]
MTTPTAYGQQLIAMHGWGGDSRAWLPWRDAAQRRGWNWQSGERGYGPLPPFEPSWPEGRGPRSVLVHSLGLHLLPRAVLEQADAVVLLASFGRFVPPGEAGRAWRAALRVMQSRIASGAGERVLQDFLAAAAAPDPVALLPAGPGHEPLAACSLERLRHDLLLLGRTSGLPAGFPARARLLIIEAGADGIVAPNARQQLCLALPKAERWLIEAAGHSLLGANLVEPVLNWLETE